MLVLVGALLRAAPGLPAQGDGLKRALALIGYERPREAESALRAIGRDDADFAAARTLIGFLALRRGAPPEAERAFREALELCPDCAAAQFGLGVALIRSGAAQEAALFLERAARDPALAERSRLEWLRSLFIAGREEECYQRAREFTALYPLVPGYRSFLGFLYQTRGKTEEALGEYRRAVELDPKRLADYFSLISLHRLRREWPAALEWTRRALALDGDHPLLYRELAEAYTHLGEARQAEEARTEAERCYEAEIRYAQALRAARAGREAQAELELRAALAANPRLSKARSELGELLRRAGRWREAYDAFLAALETDPENAGAHLGMAAVLRAQGRHAEALEVYRRALRWGVAGADVLAGMAGAYGARGQMQEAAETMLQALREFPDEPGFLSYLGYLQGSAGRKADALESYARALRLDAAQTIALLGQAGDLLGRGEIGPALAYFAAVAGSNPHEIQAWQGLIEGRRRSGDIAGAETAARACLEANPGETSCGEQLASLVLEQSRYGEAAALYQTLLRSGRSSKSILDGLAFSLLNQGKLAEAAEIFRSSLRRYGDDAWARSCLGYIARADGDLAAAIAHLRRAVELDAADADTRYDLALALYLAGEFGPAAEAFEAALRLRPGWGRAHYNLAMVYWNLRRYPQALAQARLAERYGIREAARVIAALAKD